MCENFDASTAAGQEGQGLTACTLQTTVRPFLGGIIEFGLARHLSAFVGLQYFLSNPAERLVGQSNAQVASDNESRRPLTTSTWDESLRAVIRFGVTYKF